MLMHHMGVRVALLVPRLDAIDELLGQSQPVAPAVNAGPAILVERPSRPGVAHQEAFPLVPKRGMKQPTQEVGRVGQPPGRGLIFLRWRKSHHSRMQGCLWGL